MDYNSMIKSELKDELTNRGIEYTGNANKTVLIELLQSSDENSINSERIMIRYIGRAKTASRTGAKTGEFYFFSRDNKEPMPTPVAKEDVNSLLAEIGKSCCGRVPFALFILDSEYDDATCLDE